MASKDFDSQSDDELSRYNALDCITTARAYTQILHEDEWERNPYSKRLYEIHTQLSKIAAKMYRRGFWVNESERQRLDSELSALHLSRVKPFLEAVPDKSFKCTPDSMRALIFERHATEGAFSFKLPDPPHGKDGKKFWTNDEQTAIKVNKEHLLHLYVHPSTPENLRQIIKLYWEAYSPVKARQTFVSSSKVLEAIGRDGFLRAGWNSCGTETMRWSCRAPNLMNLSEQKDGDSLGGALPNMRAMYGARPGMVLVHADYSQQELRVMQAVSGDLALKAALETGDVYSFDALNWFGGQLPAGTTTTQIKEKYKTMRKACKVTHLAFQYGAGVDAMFLQALMQDQSSTYTRTQVLRSAAHATYAQTVKYWEDELKQVRIQGYSEGRILGGRRYYPDDPPITETANYPIQRTAGELTALAMIEVDRALEKYCPGAGLVTILHDALDTECFPQQVDTVKKIYEDYMPGPFTIMGNYNTDKFTFPIDIKIGTSWAGL